MAVAAVKGDPGWCCITCENGRIARGEQHWTEIRFPMCVECGNKRCPRANHHDNACTGSNDTGQPGSAYP